MLTENQIKKLEKKLEKAKKTIESQLSKFAKEDTSHKGNYRTEFPDIGTQADESAQEITEYEQNISLEHSLEDELKFINKALKKIKDGKYGYCEACKKEIPFERLEIRPQSVMCISCKAKNEKEG
ncbi:MAG: TraR/DksA family transcriptional regulator [Candidatus Moraniibacteriota bacterium]